MDLQRKFVPYSLYRAMARDCDIALWEPHSSLAAVSFGERAIAKYTGGPYCHASATVFNQYGRLWQYGYQFWGGYGSPMSGEVERASGRIGIYRVKNLIKAESVAKHLIGDLSGIYAGKTLALVGLANLFGLGIMDRFDWFRNAMLEYSKSTTTAICSQHVDRSFGLAGIDLTGKPNSEVSPNDIWRSPLVEYICHPIRGE